VARDLAAAVGTAAHVRELRRLEVGPFPVGEAVEPAGLDDPAVLQGALRPLAAALPHLPAVTIAAADVERLRTTGQPAAAWLQSPQLAAAGLVRIHGPGNELVAVCRREGPAAAWRSAAVFPPATATAGGGAAGGTG
jgi:tRNA U55 pseudouridine synthase TruB